MPAFLKRIQPMPNVPLAYISVYQRMSDNFHTLEYASTIHNSVTGPLYEIAVCLQIIFSTYDQHIRIRNEHSKLCTDFPFHVYMYDVSIGG
jgi:hypothetical protein